MERLYQSIRVAWLIVSFLTLWCLSIAKHFIQRPFVRIRAYSNTPAKRNYSE